MLFLISFRVSREFSRGVVFKLIADENDSSVGKMFFREPVVRKSLMLLCFF